MMVSKMAQRLKTRRQFVTLTNQGRKVFGTGMMAQYLPNHLDAARIGFTVTKKLGDAVARNRIRRRLREAARLSADLSALTGFDIAIIARRESINMPFVQMQAEFEKIIRQIK